MVLYEAIVVVAKRGAASFEHAKEISATMGRLVISNGGVVTEMQYWGAHQLPYAVRKYGHTHKEGHYVLERFWTSPAVQSEMKKFLDGDSRVLRGTIIRVGNAPKSLVNRQELPPTVNF